jgi:UPF0176 protein
VLNFYAFFKVTSVEEERAFHNELSRRYNLKGTVLLASEGVNVGVSSVSREDLADYAKAFSEHSGVESIRLAWSQGKSEPFRRFRVKLKDRILVFDKNHWVEEDEIGTVEYLESNLWRDLVLSGRDDVVVLDTRNDYEIDYGTFEGAEDLNLKHFRDFPEKFMRTYGDDKDKTFLMFCTGGIRCEKAAVFARKQGFKKVYQLEGGVMKYFEEQGGKAWKGNCFVFDQRWSVTPELKEGQDGPHPDQLDRVYGISPA